MKFSTALTLPILLASSLLSVSAFAAEPSAKVTKQILDNLRQARSDLNYSEVKASPMPGLYEVRVEGGPTLYVNEDGSHFIAGDLFSIQSGRFVNIQEQERSKERAELIAKVDAKKSIVFAPKGETKAVLHVFTDVDCGYCQKLHREMEMINAKGIEVRYLAYPRSGPFSPSGQKLATAWCADDKQAELTKLKNREDVPMNVCPGNPIEEQYNLGQTMGVNGTPNMVTESGELIGGYLPADRLAQVLGLE